MNADERRYSPARNSERTVAFAGLRRLFPPGGPKFLPLTKYLQSQPRSVVRLNFYVCMLIAIIRDELPPMAYHDPAWWANNPAQEQAAAWLEAGWEVTDVDLHSGTVSFIRVK